MIGLYNPGIMHLCSSLSRAHCPPRSLTPRIFYPHSTQYVFEQLRRFCIYFSGISYTTQNIGSLNCLLTSNKKRMIAKNRSPCAWIKPLEKIVCCAIQKACSLM